MYIGIKELNKNDSYRRLKESKKLNNIAEFIEIAGGVREDVLNYFVRICNESDIPKLAAETFVNFIFLGNDIDVTWYELCMKFVKGHNASQLRWYCKELIKYAGKVDAQSIIDEFDKIDSPVMLHYYLSSQYEKNCNAEILSNILSKVSLSDLKLQKIEQTLLSANMAESEREIEQAKIEELNAKLSYYKKLYKDLSKKYSDSSSKIFSLTVENRNLKNQYKKQMESLSLTVSQLKKENRNKETANMAESEQAEVTASMAESEHMKVTASMAESEQIEVTASMAESEQIEVTAGMAESEQSEVTSGMAESEQPEVTSGMAEKETVNIKCDQKSRSERINIFYKIIKSVKIKSFERMDKIKQKEKIYSLMAQKNMPKEQVNVIVNAMKAGVSNVCLYKILCDKISDTGEIHKMIECYEMEYKNNVEPEDDCSVAIV